MRLSVSSLARLYANPCTETLLETLRLRSPEEIPVMRLGEYLQRFVAKELKLRANGRKYTLPLNGKAEIVGIPDAITKDTVYEIKYTSLSQLPRSLPVGEQQLRLYCLLTRRCNGALAVLNQYGDIVVHRYIFQQPDTTLREALQQIVDVLLPIREAAAETPEKALDLLPTALEQIQNIIEGSRKKPTVILSEKSVDLEPEYRELLNRYHELEKQKRNVEQEIEKINVEIEQIRQRIRARMELEGARLAMLDGYIVAKLVDYERRTIDAKTLRALFPQVAQKVEQKQIVRQLRIIEEIDT